MKNLSKGINKGTSKEYRRDITKEWREIKNDLNKIERYEIFEEGGEAILSETGCYKFMSAINKFRLYEE